MLRVEHDDAARLRAVRARPRAFSSRNARYWICASIESVQVAAVLRARGSLSTSSTMRPRRSLITRRLPGLPAELVLERELDALLARVVDVGEADHVRHHFAAG